MSAIDPLCDDLLPSTADIAGFLGLPQHRVARMCREGELPAFRLGRKHYAARKSVLLAMIEAREAAAARESVALTPLSRATV